MRVFRAGRNLAEINKRIWENEQELMLSLLDLPPDKACEEINKIWKKKKRDRNNRIISCIILFLLTCWFVHWFVNLA